MKRIAGSFLAALLALSVGGSALAATTDNAPAAGGATAAKGAPAAKPAARHMKKGVRKHVKKGHGKATAAKKEAATGAAPSGKY